MIVLNLFLSEKYIFLIQIPETPTWLLLKNRDEEALKSLCWLRGWTSKEAVRDEFETLKAYRESTNKCSQCQRDQIICTHPPPTLMDKFNAMFKSSCMRPILIFTICSLFTNFSGLHHVFPFSVQILNTFNCPFNPNKAIVNRRLLTIFSLLFVLFPYWILFIICIHRYYLGHHRSPLQ